MHGLYYLIGLEFKEPDKINRNLNVFSIKSFLAILFNILTMTNKLHGTGNFNA